MKKNKKVTVTVIIGLFILLVGGIFAATKLMNTSDQSADTTKQKKKLTPELDTIPVEERPYIVILPQAGGKNVEIIVNDIKKDATSMEYELEYQAGTLLQGAFGSLDLASFPAKKEILLGSCSAGGACTYHEDVKGGTLLVSFDGPTAYAHKTEWKYIENKAKETAFSSKDEKFQIESAGLKTASYLIIYRSPGAPKSLEGSLNSNVYTLKTAPGVDTYSGTADLTMRLDEDVDSTIMGWDGSGWHEFKTTRDGKTATTQVQLMEAYLVVKK